MAQILLNGIIVGCIYAILALGFNLIYGVIRFYHIAYGAMALAGGYITWTIMEYFQVNFYYSVIISSTLFSFSGIFLWKYIYKPLKKRQASDLSMLVASFGLLIIIQNTLAIIYGNATKALSLSEKIVPGYTIGPLSITFNQIMILLMCIICVVVLEMLLKKTKLGLALRAVGQNQELALIVGIKAEQMIYLSLYIGTFMATFSASLVALEIGLRPQHSLLLILKVIIACIIGGMGSIKGAMLGGLILGIAENIGTFYFGAAWQEVIAFSILILFLLFKPKGLFGIVSE